MSDDTLALALLDLDGVAVEMDGDAFVVTADIDTDDRVTFEPVCRTVFDHGAELRDVVVDGDRERAELYIRPDPDADA